jgi:Photosystem I reaction centre subunit N (PSAN or PSI-N)
MMLIFLYIACTYILLVHCLLLQIFFGACGTV